MEEKQTEIASLGEFGLIDRLTGDLKLVNSSSLRGVGDDCAVMEYRDTDVLVSTDLLVEGVHFDLTYVPLKHLGYKAAVVNFSDIYAMNGHPRQITRHCIAALSSPVRYMVWILLEETQHLRGQDW